MSRLSEESKIEDICAFFPVAKRILKRYQVVQKAHGEEILADICKDLGIEVDLVIQEILDEQALSN